MKIARVILLIYFIFLNLLPIGRFIKMEFTSSCKTKCNKELCHKNQKEENQTENDCKEQFCIFKINPNTVFVFFSKTSTTLNYYLQVIVKQPKFSFDERLTDDYSSKIWQPPQIA